MVKEYGFTNYIDIGNTGNDVPMDSLTPEERKKVAYALQEQVMRVSGMRRVTKTNSEQSERTAIQAEIIKYEAPLEMPY